MTTDTSEGGLEDIIVADLTGLDLKATRSGGMTETPEPFVGLTHYRLGDRDAYDRDYAVDLSQLTAFIAATQPDLAEELDLKTDGPTRRAFLSRLQGEITRNGVIHVLRNGLKHRQHAVDLFYGFPSAGNPKAAALNAENRFSVTRQLRYSRDGTAHALDLAIFINGLPVFTFELKNSLTKQTVADAEEQYRRDRDPRERLFEFGRCIAHFAVDDAEVRFCPHLQGKASWFLPFNKGWNDGAGNPPNPDGLKTDYLWKDILKPQSLTDIIENYTQIVSVDKRRLDPRTGRRTTTTERVQVFPRYHQLDVVRKLLDDARRNSAGRRYLIQHSAGSGKSNSIAWLAHQLVGLKGPGQADGADIFDSVIVVTDRRILDKQLNETLRGFAQVGATIGHADRSGDLRRFLDGGKKIIVTTVQKFPHVLDDIAGGHGDRRFAIVIDEAHSSQGGRTASQMNQALSGSVTEEEDTAEDIINRLMEAKKLLPNASYFAFTATPKNKTLELFGEPVPRGDTTGRTPFHSYTMKQATQEGFIQDVLQSYTPVGSYYRLVKTVDEDPEVDTKRAKKKLRRYVESHDHAIRLKAEIMVDHFHEQVIAQQKIGGRARAMVVTSGIERAVQYYRAFQAYLAERKSPWKAIIAFSGEHDFGDGKVTEASLNGFPSNDIPDRIEEDPYRFLICADKFQTGYDQPLLHTMYVDKTLSGVKAVQTLSRLNRAHPKKHDVFVLDFANDADAIQAAFEPYYRTTLLSAETDPNRLHDLKADLDAAIIYDRQAVETLADLYLAGGGREKLDPILDQCVAEYVERLDEDGQVQFKGTAKAFVRAYGFLSTILPYTSADWERLSIFLNFLIPKLPAPKEEDLAKGVLEAIDMDSYRVEKLAAQKVLLADADAEIDPVPMDGGGSRPEPEMDRLSNVIATFNDLFGGIDWSDLDRVHRLVGEDIPTRVAADPAYRNARDNSDKDAARLEHDRALARVMMGLMKDDTTLFKQFSDNPDFKAWLSNAVFRATYAEGGRAPS
ncbi:MAG: DEAD/DEAH box helicase [Brevundimonas sp.]|nr:MAG: DEAD/DEAH box helicase [Brevundimonas sp.]